MSAPDFPTLTPEERRRRVARILAQGLLRHLKLARRRGAISSGLTPKCESEHKGLEVTA